MWSILTAFSDYCKFLRLILNFNEFLYELCTVFRLFYLMYRLL